MIDFDDVWDLTLRDSDISEHLLTLYGLVVATDTKTVLEIGAGQSTYVLTAAINKTRGQFYSMDLTREARERLFPTAPDLEKEPRYHFVQGDSSIIDWDQPLDFLFIDSGHTYDLTTLELEKYSYWVKANGFICLHDTGEFNNIFSDCRRAMLDFLEKTDWKFKTLNNQNGLSIIRKT